MVCVSPAPASRLGAPRPQNWQVCCFLGRREDHRGISGCVCHCHGQVESWNQGFWTLQVCRSYLAFLSLSPPLQDEDTGLSSEGAWALCKSLSLSEPQFPPTKWNRPLWAYQ